MHLEDLDLEQRLSRFEAQLDRFSVALHQWQQTQEQGQAVGAHGVDQQMQRFEVTLEREAEAFRRMLDEPLKQMQAHAASLREICATASYTVAGLDQVESRLAAVQADMHVYLSELSRSFQAIAAGLRDGASAALSTQTPAAPWQLDRVVELHDELRRASGARDTVRLPEQVPELPPASPRPVPFEGAGEERSMDAPRRRRTLWFVAAGVAVVALLLGFGWWIDAKVSDVAARATAAEREAASATQLANREISLARQAADKQIAEARQSAQRAETIGSIVTAPDLVRFNLIGSQGPARSTAQISWSRTRGLVLSASRLPAVAPQMTYQLWLLTSNGRVSAGVFAPDATGRATFVTDSPVSVVGAVVGAEVTVEPAGGRPTPSGPPVMTRPSI
jgi:hypothetical protein